MFKKVFVWLICKTLPSCREVTELVSRSMETKLSWRKKIELKLHLWSCVACNRYLFQLKFMREVFEIQEDKFNRNKKIPTLSSDAAERLKNALKSSKFLLLFALMYCF